MCFIHRALAAFRAAHNWSYPRPGNAEDAEEVYKLACSLNHSSVASAPGSSSSGTEGGSEGALVSDISAYHRLITRFAMCCAGSLSPMAAVAGGVVAQEVLKAASGEKNVFMCRSYHVCMSCVQWRIAIYLTPQQSSN
jgi:hypothetical protein